jgi:hypothetical protein
VTASASNRSLPRRAAKKLQRRWIATRGRIDLRLRQKLPRPVYQVGVGRYNAVRRLSGLGPGRGRLLPEFLIIGSVKAGTTSLYGWLSEHPYIAPASTKEVHYFDYNHYRGLDWYRQHFPRNSARGEFAAEHGRPFITGEASPSYISHFWVPERIARVMPDVKLIVALRDPVDRAYSQFQMSRREEEEPYESFDRALDVEDERLDPERARMWANPRYNSWPIGCWSYMMRSRYAEQIERWFERFGRDQFHFLTLDELSTDPEGTLGAVHEFLQLPAFIPDELPHLHAAPSYDSLERQTRERLQEYFRPHNQRLYELIGRDLGWERSGP